MSCSTRLEIFQGNSIEYEVTVLDGDGVAFDLTGYTPLFTVKKNPSEPFLLQATGTIVANVITYVVDAEDNDLTPNNYQFDMVIEQTGLAHTLANGIFAVKDSVTY